GSVQLTDVSSAVSTLGLWGPRARDLLERVSDHDLSDAAFGFGTAQDVQIGPIPASLLRISYVGELGWEIHVPVEHGLRLWDELWAAGEDLGLLAAGIGVYGTTGRLEKGYRLMGAELTGEYDPVEADLALPKVKTHDFVGKDACLAARRGGAAVHARGRDGHRRRGDRRRRRGRLHAGRRAGPRARRITARGREGATLRRHLGRSRSVAGPLPADGVPAAAAGRPGHGAAGRVPGQAIPGHRAHGGPHARLRSRGPADEGLRAADVPHHPAAGEVSP